MKKVQEPRKKESRKKTITNRKRKENRCHRLERALSAIERTRNWSEVQHMVKIEWRRRYPSYTMQTRGTRNCISAKRERGRRETRRGRESQFSQRKKQRGQQQRKTGKRTGRATTKRMWAGIYILIFISCLLSFPKLKFTSALSSCTMLIACISMQENFVPFTNRQGNFERFLWLQYTVKHKQFYVIIIKRFREIQKAIAEQISVFVFPVIQNWHG